MPATRKQVREHLGSLLTTHFNTVVDDVYDHVKMKFPGSAMMISSAGTVRLEPVFKAHIPVYGFSILVWIPRKNDEDEDFLDDISEQMTSFIDDNQSTTYWAGIPKSAFSSSVAPVELNEREQYWFEEYTLEVVAK